MRIRDILRSKGSYVFTIEPDRTVHEAMGSMVDREIGCLVVMEDGAIVGIITERDILKFTNRRTREVDDVQVSDVMTADVIIGGLEDAVDHVMAIMTENRVRHLPVLDGGQLVGLVSIGDLVNAIRRDVEMENRYMHSYIAGVVR